MSFYWLELYNITINIVKLCNCIVFRNNKNSRGRRGQPGQGRGQDRADHLLRHLPGETHQADCEGAGADQGASQGNESLLAWGNYFSSHLLQFNFVGKLLGPKGNSMKRLQEHTMTKMAVLGRGSMRDRQKVEERMGCCTGGVSSIVGGV